MEQNLSSELENETSKIFVDKINYFIPCASPPLVKTAIHWPAPSTFSKVGNRVRAKASLLAAGSSVSKSNETSSAFRLRGCFPVPEGDMSCFSLLVSSMSKYKITWDIIVDNVYRLYPNSPRHRPQYMQHCTDRCFLHGPKARDLSACGNSIVAIFAGDWPIPSEVLRKLDRCVIKF